MESMRDIDRAMEREIAKGSCPLRFVFLTGTAYFPQSAGMGRK